MRCRPRGERIVRVASHPRSRGAEQAHRGPERVGVLVAQGVEHHRDLVNARPACPFERAERVVGAEAHRPIDVVLRRNAVTEGPVCLVDDRQHDALGDTHLTIEELIADGDRVALRWQLTAIHQGEYLGVAPTGKPVTFHGRRLRALHPFDEQDRLLLESVNRGEFTINGFRNKDLQTLLFPTAATTAPQSRRRSAAVSRKLRLLRAHHLIRKISRTHRYQLTALGRQIIVAVLAASSATVNTFIPKAA